MNPALERLYQAAAAPQRTILGLMSGTSLDGLDLALCRLHGYGPATRAELLHFQTVPYPESQKEAIREVFAQSQVSLEKLTALNATLARYHARLVQESLHAWGVACREVDLLASHGQTIYHAPRHQHRHPEWPHMTLQLGDGDHLAYLTGLLTLSDFRQKHVAAGGEGAPLAVYGDYLLFSSSAENRIMLNMGGIANFTFLPKAGNAATVFVTDTGPGNTLLDAFTRRFFQQPFDANATHARAGHINPALLTCLKSHPFFSFPLPRTTGPELFNTRYVENALQQTGSQDLTPEDILATLTRFSAETIAGAVRQVARPEDFYFYGSGGGVHNPLLMAHLQELLPGCWQRSDALGVPADAKEAVLFAVLANETLAGGPTDFGPRSGVPSVTFGKISLPT